MLEELDRGLWTATQPLDVAGLSIGARMSVVRLPDGGLWVHSPIELDEQLAEAIDALGPVRAIVAPNRYHHLFLRPWFERWPQAERWAAPGLPERRHRLQFTGVLGDAPAPSWEGCLEQHLIAGAPALGEVVFFHPDTRTLLLTDLAFNMQHASGWGRLVWKLNGVDRRFGPSRMIRMLVRDRAAFRRSVERILKWDFDRVLIAHGEPIPRGGRATFEAAFR